MMSLDDKEGSLVFSFFFFLSFFCCETILAILQKRERGEMTTQSAGKLGRTLLDLAEWKSNFLGRTASGKPGTSRLSSLLHDANKNDTSD